MSFQEFKQVPYFRAVIIIAVLAVVGIIGLIASNIGPKSVNNELQTRETANIDYVQSSLALYHVNNGNYPSAYERLIEDKDDAQAKELLTGATSILKNFDYSVSGDRQTYKITYDALNGEPVEVKFNYQNDFN